MRVGLFLALLAIASPAGTAAACADARFLLLIFNAGNHVASDDATGRVLSFKTHRACRRAGEALARKLSSETGRFSYICVDRGSAS